MPFFDFNGDGHTDALEFLIGTGAFIEKDDTATEETQTDDNEENEKE